MQDFLARLERLQAAAAECDLIANLAADVQKREMFNKLAADYRAMAKDIEKIIAIRQHPPK